MPDDRRCPRCGSEPTPDHQYDGTREPQYCSKYGCELPYWLWDDWEKLQRKRDDIEELLTTLEFAHGAIMDAIGCEDGLDGYAGDSILVMIEKVLCSHKRLELVRTSVRQKGEADA